jgi:quercetin dioxygenase-like cupin family protein
MARWPVLVVLGSVLAGAASPQYRISADPQDRRIEFEDAWVRVLRISVDAGETTAVQEHPDGVLIFLTADLEGRMPPAEALWQPAGSRAIENRAKTRFEALLIEFKVARSDIPAPLAPELAPAEPTDVVAYWPYDRGTRRVTSLIDNERVAVSKHRLVPLIQTERCHFHPREAVLVYLSRGELSGSTARYGFRRARRGEFDVLPANTLHALRNMGTDPIEFLIVWPK